MDTDQKLALGIFCTMLICSTGCLAFSCRSNLLPSKSNESENQKKQEEQHELYDRIL